MYKTESIVKELQINNTYIKICDDYCRNKASGDIERILQNIAKNALESFNRPKVESL